MSAAVNSVSSESLFHGVVVVNKPQDWTSHDVVAKMRGVFGTRRIGHLGTLDPIATGVLPLMVGNATRLAQFLQSGEKEYDALIRFGWATSTYDRQGEPMTLPTDPVISVAQLEGLLLAMTGEIEQVPPPVSAKKIGGVPAYKMARNKIQVELKPVRVHIHEARILWVEGPRARIVVRCSPGTYVRSIAHDLGARLNFGAHIEELIRLRSGGFRMEQARTMEEISNLKNDGQLDEVILPAETLLPEFPSVYLDEATVRQVRQGQDFHTSPFRVSAGTQHVKAIGPDGKLVAIGNIVLPLVYHPGVVF